MQPPPPLAPPPSGCDPEVLSLPDVQPLPGIESRALAVSRDGKEAFVAAADATSLTRVNLDTGATTSIMLAEAKIVGATLVGSTLAVADANLNTLRLVDTVTGETTATIPLGETPTSVTAEEDRLYVSLATKVRVLSTTGDLIGEIPLPAPGPVTPADGRLWIPIPSTGMLVLVDIETLAVLAQVPVGDEPVSVAVCDRALVADRAGSAVRALNLETLAVEATIPATAPSEVGTTADYAFVRTDGTIAILDCVTGEMDCEIVLGSHGEAVEAAESGRLVASTRAGTRVVVIDPQCIEVTPEIASLDRAYGVPGTLIHATGAFPPGTAFVVQVDDVAVERVVAQINADGSRATFEVPLDAPEGDLTIAATRSSEAAVMETGVWIRCTPTPFESLNVSSAIAKLIAEIQAKLDDPALPTIAAQKLNQARAKLRDAIRMLQQAREKKLAEGDLEGVVEKLKVAFKQLEDAETKASVPSGIERRVAVEIAQYAVYRKLAALSGRLGPDHAALLESWERFGEARVLFASDRVRQALEAHEEIADLLEPAAELARPLTVAQMTPVLVCVHDALFAFVPHLEEIKPDLGLTAAEEVLYQEVIDRLGPRADGSFSGTATSLFAVPDLDAGLVQVRGAMEGIESLVNQGVPVLAIAKEFMLRLLEAYDAGVDAIEQNVGPIDEAVGPARTRIEEAEASLNPEFVKAVTTMSLIQVYLSQIPTASQYDLVAGPMQDVVQGLPLLFPYAVLRTVNKPGYVNISIHATGSLSVLPVASGDRLPGGYQEQIPANFPTGSYVGQYVYIPYFEPNPQPVVKVLDFDTLESAPTPTTCPSLGTSGYSGRAMLLPGGSYQYELLGMGFAAGAQSQTWGQIGELVSLESLTPGIIEIAHTVDDWDPDAIRINVSLNAVAPGDGRFRVLWRQLLADGSLQEEAVSHISHIQVKPTLRTINVRVQAVRAVKRVGPEETIQVGTKRFLGPDELANIEQQQQSLNTWIFQIQPLIHAFFIGAGLNVQIMGELRQWPDPDVPEITEEIQEEWQSVIDNLFDDSGQLLGAHSAQAMQLAETHNRDGQINVYLIRGPIVDPGSPVGMTYWIQGSDVAYKQYEPAQTPFTKTYGIYLADTAHWYTLAHEIGHAFGLSHWSAGTLESLQCILSVDGVTPVDRNFMHLPAPGDNLKITNGQAEPVYYVAGPLLDKVQW